MPGALSPDAGMDWDRDRDAAGRAKNARPRDSLGRPLARDATGEQMVSYDEPLPPDQALATAQRLLDTDMPFQAHEVLEAAWKAAPLAERDLWQGLAQLAVGITHAKRGNARGAAALLRRGAARLAGYPPLGPHGIDVAVLQARAEEIAAQVEHEGLAGIDGTSLQVRLVSERDLRG
ncbi:MAG TPA: DUF309 domain-containing protein [Streptosporangiaceae bacterium]|nr:DUF309 domain-containing protein [Streptosporangiaceae bacterium]